MTWIEFLDDDGTQGYANDEDGTFSAVYNGKYDDIHDLLTEADNYKPEDPSEREGYINDLAETDLFNPIEVYVHDGAASATDKLEHIRVNIDSTEGIVAVVVTE